MDNEQSDLPKRERLLDHVPEHAEIIDAQIQSSTTAQRIADARRRGVGGEYEAEQEKCW